MTTSRIDRLVSNEASPPDASISLGNSREGALELAVFLFLIVPSMVLSFFAVRQGQVPFPLVAASTIARDLSQVALILLFLRKNGEAVASVGWRVRNLAREVILGIVLFPVLFLVSTFIDSALRSDGFSGPTSQQPSLIPSQSPGQIALAVVLVAVVAISEETIFRGYLIRRLEQVTGSAGWAIVLSAAIFSIGHGYEGAAGVITVGVTGAALGLVYRWRRSIVAPVVMHFLLDLVAIVILPLLIG
jgi:uncharacterized protein